MTDPKDLLIAFYEAIIERNAHRMFQMTPEESKYLAELKQQINATQNDSPQICKEGYYTDFSPTTQTTHEAFIQNPIQCGDLKII